MDSAVTVISSSHDMRTYLVHSALYECAFFFRTLSGAPTWIYVNTKDMAICALNNQTW